MAAGANPFTLIISAPLYALPPLLETTRPLPAPGSVPGEQSGYPSQLAKGNAGGVNVTAGIGVTVDNVA